MRVLHITHNDFDGAGRAVVRLHKALQKVGVDSNIALLYSKNKDIENNILKIGYGETFRQFLRDITSIKFLLKYRSYLKIIYFLRLKLYVRIFTIFFKPKDLFNFNVCQPTDTQLGKMIKNYDIIVLHGTQGIISPKNILKFYIEFGVKFFMHPLDMEPITGGCHFNFKCTRWKNSCGKCPQLSSASNNDPSLSLLEDKKNSYRHVPIHWIACNTFFEKILKESPVVSSKHKISTIKLGVDSERYSILNKTIARNICGLPLNKKIILFGCFDFNSPRKGAALLKDAIKSCFKKDLNRNICLVTFGELNGFSFDDTELQWIHVGSISSDRKMNALYRSADLLVSPSIDDLGPTVVVEAFMNDLPIVAFNIGVAQDIVIDNINGNLVDCFDVVEFGKMIKKNILLQVASFRDNKNLIKTFSQCTVNEEALSFKKAFLEAVV